MKRYTIYGRLIPLSENGIPQPSFGSIVSEQSHDVCLASDAESLLLKLDEAEKRLAFAADGLAVVERRRDALKAERDAALLRLDQFCKLAYDISGQQHRDERYWCVWPDQMRKLDDLRREHRGEETARIVETPVTCGANLEGGGVCCLPDGHKAWHRDALE